MNSTKAILCLVVFSSFLLLGCSYKITEPHPLLNVSFNSSANPSPIPSENESVNQTENSSVDTTTQPANSSVSKPRQSTTDQAQNQPPPPSNPTPPDEPGTLETHERYLLLLPKHPNMLNDSIIIFAFSPSGDAGPMIDAWRPAAEKRGWPIFASKTFHNGELPDSFGTELGADIDNVTLRLGYAKPKAIVTGVSGGGQFSHAFSVSDPNFVTVVVSNCGIIKREYYELKEYYPHNKIALFIASPTDFRYAEMKEDREFLASLGWKTGWIEFGGGHALAPPSTYEQAAQWLEQTIGNGAK